MWGSVELIGSGIPLRLKRRAQKELVIRRTRELAEPGHFDGWQSIAFQLHFFDGFSKAHVSINGPLKKELNLLCLNARYEGQVRALKSQQNDARKIALRESRRGFWAQNWA
jgi:hypothetical protein